LLAAFLFTALALPAAAWDVAQDATAENFHAFHRRFSSDAYHYPGHGASPLGLIGFDVYAQVSGDQGFDDDAEARNVINGSLTGGGLYIGRVGVRKGLPGGIDLGVAYEQALGGDVKLASVDVQWAFLHGGVLSPAVAVRLTGTETLQAQGYDLRQYGAELLVSKGFTILTPYAGAGIVRSRGKHNGVHTGTQEDTVTQGVAYAGITLNLLLPKISVEVEKADAVQASVRVGFGL
jgi:opacity protein-like surface antigen